MSKQSVRLELVEAVAHAAAAFGEAADAVDTATATALGINSTDLRIAGLLLERGQLAAGELADAAELSPAAMSTAIQRLVAAGYVDRLVDAVDRRRAVVGLTDRARALLDWAYGPVKAAGRAQLRDFTEDELLVILDFLRRGHQVQHDQARRIREASAGTPVAGRAETSAEWR